MRFLASWWERVPRRHLSVIVAVVAVAAVVGTQVSAPQAGSSASRVKLATNGTNGEVWV
jgi:hypothetical protein